MPYLNSESDWLLQFDKPLPGEMAQLRAILAAATVASNKTENRLRGELEHAVAVEGSLDHVLARIADRLEADYVESRVERSREPWSFGYVVKDLFPANSVIEVLTRFFDPIRGVTESVLHGRSILRIDNDRYIVWLEG